MGDFLATLALVDLPRCNAWITADEFARVAEEAGLDGRYPDPWKAPWAQDLEVNGRVILRVSHPLGAHDVSLAEIDEALKREHPNAS